MRDPHHDSFKRARSPCRRHTVFDAKYCVCNSVVLPPKAENNIRTSAQRTALLVTVSCITSTVQRRCRTPRLPQNFARVLNSIGSKSSKLPEAAVPLMEMEIVTLTYSLGCLQQGHKFRSWADVFPDVEFGKGEGLGDEDAQLDDSDDSDDDESFKVRAC